MTSAAGWLGLTAGAATGFGLVLVLLARGSRVDPLMTLTTSVATMVVLLALAGPRAGRRPRTPARASLPAVVAVGVTDVAAGLAYAQASTQGSVSVVAVLASLHPVVVLLLARRLHHERLRRSQVLAVAASLVGAVTLGFG